MKAFRVVVDGKSLGDLGIANFANASVIIGFGRGSAAEPVDYRLHVGGITESDENGVHRHYRWACPSIQERSRIEIEIVESEDCLPPTRLYKSDHEVREPAFSEKELREMRYQSYMELKREFEP